IGPSSQASRLGGDFIARRERLGANPQLHEVNKVRNEDVRVGTRHRVRIFNRSRRGPDRPVVSRQGNPHQSSRPDQKAKSRSARMGAHNTPRGAAANARRSLSALSALAAAATGTPAGAATPAFGRVAAQRFRGLGTASPAIRSVSLTPLLDEGSSEKRF